MNASDYRLLRYGKREIEELARAVSQHWGGALKDWTLVVTPGTVNGSACASLHVSIELASGTHVTTIPLGGTAAGELHATPPRLGRVNDQPTVAVRRKAFLSLLEHCGTHGPEPVLGYLRCCGVMVID